MTEEPQDLPVSADDLLLVEDAHPGRGACPICGYEAWYTIQGPGDKLPTLPQGNLEGAIIVANGHPLVTVACQRCGFVRSHIKPIFDAYVKYLREIKAKEELEHERD